MRTDRIPGSDSSSSLGSDAPVVAIGETPFILRLRVHSARDLRFATSRESYCKLYIGDTPFSAANQPQHQHQHQPRSTSTSSHSSSNASSTPLHRTFHTCVYRSAELASATWDERFDIPLLHLTEVLSIRVKSKQRLEAPPIGSCAIHLKQLAVGKVFDQAFPLFKGREQVGKIRLQLCIQPSRDEAAQLAPKPQPYPQGQVHRDSDGDADKRSPHLQRAVDEYLQQQRQPSRQSQHEQYQQRLRQHYRPDGNAKLEQAERRSNQDDRENRGGDDWMAAPLRIDQPDSRSTPSTSYEFERAAIAPRPMRSPPRSPPSSVHDRLRQSSNPPPPRITERRSVPYDTPPQQRPQQPERGVAPPRLSQGELSRFHALSREEQELTQRLERIRQEMDALRVQSAPPAPPPAISPLSPSRGQSQSAPAPLLKWNAVRDERWDGSDNGPRNGTPGFASSHAESRVREIPVRQVQQAPPRQAQQQQQQQQQPRSATVPAPRSPSRRPDQTPVASNTQSRRPDQPSPASNPESSSRPTPTSGQVFQLFKAAVKLGTAIDEDDPAAAVKNAVKLGTTTAAIVQRDEQRSSNPNATTATKPAGKSSADQFITAGISVGKLLGSADEDSGQVVTNGFKVAKAFMPLVQSRGGREEDAKKGTKAADANESAAAPQQSSRPSANQIFGAVSAVSKLMGADDEDGGDGGDGGDDGDGEKSALKVGKAVFGFLGGKAQKS